MVNRRDRIMMDNVVRRKTKMIIEWWSTKERLKECKKNSTEGQMAAMMKTMMMVKTQRTMIGYKI